MADSLARMRWARDKATQDRMHYYLFEQAKAVKAATSPDADELALANRVYDGSVNLLSVGLICSVNATIGAAIDAGTEVLETDIQYVVTVDQWAAMAAAGV